MASTATISIASALLAGVLFRFGLEVFVSMQTQFILVFAMFLVYLIFRRAQPRYAIVAALAVGIVIAALRGLLHVDELQLELAQPIFIRPTFSVSALVGVALPLFIVTMASQNVPGVAALRGSGYTNVPISPVIGWTGVVTILLAPFGAFALNLAAITAAICTGREAHEDPDKRYVAAVAAGVSYVLVGLFGATVVALFAAFPKELVLAIGGLALFGTIGNGLAAALGNEKEREPGRKRVDWHARLSHRFDDRDRVRHREVELFHRRGAGLVDVVPADVDRVVARKTLGAVDDQIPQHAHRGPALSPSVCCCLDRGSGQVPRSDHRIVA